jgi:hypothetical protein
LHEPPFAAGKEQHIVAGLLETPDRAVELEEKGKETDDVLRLMTIWKQHRE